MVREMRTSSHNAMVADGSTGALFLLFEVEAVLTLSMGCLDMKLDRS